MVSAKQNKRGKKAATAARDRRGRKTRAEERASGVRTTVSLRVDANELARIDSDATLQGKTRSELMRQRILNRPPDEGRVAEYTRRLYYGMRETAVESLESGRAQREAYEEYARAAHVLSVAIDRVGVNLNQIARRVNSGAVVGDEAAAWLALLSDCRDALATIAYRDRVDEVRPAPTLAVVETASHASSATAASTAVSGASEALENAAENEAGNVVEIGVGNEAKNEPENAVENVAENEPETVTESKQKKKLKPKPETKQKSKENKSVEPAVESETEGAVAAGPASSISKGDERVPLSDAMYKPYGTGAEKDTVARIFADSAALSLLGDWQAEQEQAERLRQAAREARYGKSERSE